MKNINKVVFGLYDTRAAVDEAVINFQKARFRSADISALLPMPSTTKELAHTNTTKMPEGAAVGSGTGTVVGGVLGWLAGVGSLAIPGVGPLIAAGPIMAALAGAGIGGTLGAVAGGLVGMGMPEYEAHRFEGFIKKGGYLLSVHCDDDEWVKKATEIFEATGAHDISCSKESESDSPEIINKDKPHTLGHVFR